MLRAQKDMKEGPAEEGPAEQEPEQEPEQGTLERKRRYPGGTKPNPGTVKALAALETEIRNKTVSLEVALLLLIRKYRLDFDTLKCLAETKLNCSFSQTRYKDIAPIFNLDRNSGASDMLPLHIYRSRIPLDLLKEICDDLRQAELQYGNIEEHENEEARSRYLAALFNRLVCLFEKRIINRPEKLFSGGVTSKGKIEYQFMSLNSVIIVFVEVKREMAAGSARLDQIAQVMAEADGCDFFNDDCGHWVPMRGVLCDGLHFQFFEYDSSDSTWRQSHTISGVNYTAEDNEGFIGSVKRVCEFMYDFLLQGFLDSLIAFSNRSNGITPDETEPGTSTAATELSRQKRRPAKKLKIAVIFAEKALEEARAGAEMADNVRARLKISNKRSHQDTDVGGPATSESFEQAEDLAILSLHHLRLSVRESPEIYSVPTFMDEWDSDSYIGL